MSEQKRVCTRLLERASAQGASWAEVALEESSARVCLGRKDGPRLSGPDRSVHLRLGLEDGRVGQAAGPARDEGELQSLVQQALGRAREASPDALEGPAERMDLPVQGLQIADPRASRLDDADRREVVAFNEDAVRAVSRGLVTLGVTYEERVTQRLVATTRGQEGAETSTRFRLRAVVRPQGHPDMEVSGLVESRRFADVASMPLGTEVGRRALAMSSPASWPERRMPLVVEPRVLATLLPAVAAAFDGDRVESGRSFLRSEALNASQPVGATRLHVVDDASLPGALATRAFDDRGVAPMPLPLIREGMMGALYRSPRSARRHGTRPTGHTRADGSPWPGTLIVRPGARSRNMMFPDVGRYLLIDEILDLSGLDVATGRMCIPVRAALGEQGHILGGLGTAVLDTTITAFFDAISEMASDTERHGTVDACTWVLEGISLMR